MQNNIITKCLVAGIFISLVTLFASAQEKTAMPADQTLRSNARVNPSTLGMELSIPLAAYPGRGPGASVSLSYSSKLWRLADGGIHQPVNSQQCISLAIPQFGELSAAGWTTSTAVPYIEYTGRENIYWADGTVMNVPTPGCGDAHQNADGYYVRRIIVHMPGGGSHELRADDSPIAFEPGNQNDPFWPTNQANWNTTYYAVDGSNVKYVENSTTGTYRLLLTDGSHIDFGGTLESLTTFDISRTIRKATQLKDKHGNTITYHAPDATHPNGYQTDTMGRDIPTPIGLEPPANPTPASSPQAYSVPGFGTGSLTYYLHWKRLKGATAGESALTNFSDTLCYKAAGMPGGQQPPQGSCGLFSHTTGDGKYFWAVAPAEDGEFNPVVLARIDLPNGASYKFGYDIYGRINKIDYPTGASETFTYSAVPVLAQMNYPAGDFHKQANFGVTSRKVYPEASGSYYEWAYSAAYAAANAYKVSVTSPDGTLGERLIHRDAPSVHCAEGCGGGSFGFDDPLAGMAYEELSYDSSDPRKLLSRQLTTWTSTTFAQQGTGNPSWHPRVTKVESITCDPLTAACLSSTTTTGYVGTLSQITDAVHPNLVTQYGFSTVIGALGPLLKTTETDYLSDPNYTARNIRSLPTEVRVKDANNALIAKSQFVYDESLYFDNNYSTTNWTDPQTSARGNVTTQSVWVSETASWLESHTMFDNFGNVRKVWDASGDATKFVETLYDPAYNYAYPTKVISPAPDPSDTHGTDQTSTVETTYDFSTGLPLTVKDDFGQITKTEYDSMLRPVRVFAYNFTAPETQTIYGVPDANGQLPPDQRFVKVRKQIDATNWDEATTWADGLGRAIKTQAKDSQGDVFVETVYDEMGRVERVTNPYRLGDTVYWSKTRYDDLGRAVETYAPTELANLASAQSLGTSAFSFSTVPNFIGTVVTTTDASGRKGRSITNALGQLIRVDEPTATGGTETSDLGTLAAPTQPTFYTYSPQGKMVKVQQGVQNRYFLYDSLGRLLRVRQPEQDVNASLNLSDPITGNSQWTAGFTYDVLGNVLTATDAKGTVITNTYDRANRVKTRSYSNEPAGIITPAVSFYYDGKGLSAPQSPNYAKGKLTKVTSSVSATEYQLFDNFGRLTQSAQITDGQTYTSKYTYNLSGALIEEEYPSGRKVRNEFEPDGDLMRIFGQATPTATERTYANSFSYTPDGRIERLKLGNGLWERAGFNSRLQVTELNLGWGLNGDLWKLGYQYGEIDGNGNVDTTKNTGNVARQTLSFTGLTHPFVQSYKHDSLYRITEAKETVNGQQTWIQNWNYDRYGNRTLFSQNIGGQQMAVNNLSVPSVDAATNRFQTGQGYTFDKNGNLTNDPVNGNRQFIFNGDNKQTEVRDINGIPIGQYFYDGEGRRIKKVTAAETTIFVYSNGKLIAEYSTAAPPQNPTTNWTVTDQLGSPRVLVNSSGDVVSRRDFMPFGEELYADTQNRTVARKYSLTGQDSVRKRFTGYEKDAETGLDFAEARYYNNQHARFTAVDPLLASGKSANPQTFNRYVYVLNNPLLLTDPTGLQAATVPDGEPEVIRVNTYWDSAKNTFGTFTGYLKSLGMSVEQAVRYYAYSNGGTDDFGFRTSSGPAPPTRQFGGIINPTTGPAITEFNNNMDKFNQQVIQPTPLLSNLVNAQMNGRDGDILGFATEMGMFGVDLGTTVFTGGTGNAGRKALQEGIETGGSQGFKLALGLGDDLFDFAKSTGSTTYFERTGSKYFIPEKFEKMAFDASEINFNLGKFSFGRHADWIRQGEPFVPSTATSYELNFVLSSEELLKKTKFSVYP